MRLPALAVAAASVWALMAQVTPPRPTYRAQPEYSPEARLAAVECTVAMKLPIGADGVPGDLQVTRPCGYGLDEKAVAAVRTWKFDPATKDGAAVETQATIEVNFRLGGEIPPWQVGPMLFPELNGAARPVLARAVFPDAEMPARPGEKFTLQFDVSESGSVENVSPLSGSPSAEPERLAIEAVRQWTFSPAQCDGKPVRARATLMWYSAKR